MRFDAKKAFILRYIAWHLCGKKSVKPQGFQFCLLVVDGFVTHRFEYLGTVGFIQWLMAFWEKYNRNA